MKPCTLGTCLHVPKVQNHFYFFRPTWLRSTSGIIVVSCLVLRYVSQSSCLSLCYGVSICSCAHCQCIHLSRCIPFVVRRRDILCSIRDTTVLGRSAGVIKKGIRHANVDFVVLRVSREGKCHNAWCSAARVCFTRNRASRRACGI